MQSRPIRTTIQLVDTHLLLWWASMPEQQPEQQPEQLPEAAQSRLAKSMSPLFFCLVSLWDVAIKASLCRVSPPRWLCCRHPGASAFAQG